MIRSFGGAIASDRALWRAGTVGCQLQRLQLPNLFLL